MKVRLFSRRRKALLCILAVALLANAAYFCLAMRPQSQGNPPELPKYVLEPLNANGTLVGERHSDPLPIYDGETWSVGGRTVTKLDDYLLNTNEWDAPHTFGTIIQIELAGNGTSEDFRRSIEALAAQGICRIAVFDRSAPVAQQGLETAVRVRSFRDESGISHNCVDRVQRW